jgi:hypothetical protein
MYKVEIKISDWDFMDDEVVTIQTSDFEKAQIIQEFIEMQRDYGWAVDYQPVEYIDEDEDNYVYDEDADAWYWYDEEADTWYVYDEYEDDWVEFVEEDEAEEIEVASVAE